MRIKHSTAALMGVIGLIAAGTFAGSSTAQARQPHWFYNDYDRYDNQAYDDESYGRNYDDDQYIVYAPPRRVRPNHWQRRQQMRRWARIKRQRAERREFRRNQQRYNRPNRQRLYDAWQNGQDNQYVAPRRKQVTKTAPRKRQRIKLSYVPLPRIKPYHLIPGKTGGNKSFAHKFTLDGPKTKNRIASVKPRVASAKPAKIKTTTNYQPIRIKVVKRPISDDFRQRRAQTKKLTSNQLSCNKAKSIVQGFGFSNISTRTCSGTIYDFTAKRDGKPYSIKVSSLSGELKGVKKIK